jgi:hypothetical protein
MKGLMKYVNKNISGAKQALSDFSYARKATKKAKENIKELAIKKAKKSYTDETGKEMTPSKLKMDMEGMILPGPTKRYLDTKKKVYKDTARKFKV